jgi:glycerophosphoryl diester phosphodiesterase
MKVNWAVILALTVSIVGPATMSKETNRSRKPLLIAHRGASGFAPEHTLASYELAIRQGADFVEQDLQMTKDGILICLHDADLSRTTNVRDVFPDRSAERDPEETGKPKRGWYPIDFTLAEIKRLDAGSWFNRANPFAADPAFAGQKVPTLEEAAKLIGKRAGLYVELKDYEFYKRAGFDMVDKLVNVLEASGFDRRGGEKRIFIQSFSKASLLRMMERAPRYRRIQLLPMEDAGRDDSSKATPALAKEIAAYAQGVGPSKSMLSGAAEVDVFHAEGLLVHPYTFRGSTTAGLRKPLTQVEPNGMTFQQNVVADIQRFLGYGIDGGFTDYPVLWREAVLGKR